MLICKNYNKLLILDLQRCLNYLRLSLLLCKMTLGLLEILLQQSYCATNQRNYQCTSLKRLKSTLYLEIRAQIKILELCSLPT